MKSVFKSKIIDHFGPGLNKSLFDFIDKMKEGDTLAMTEILRNLMEMLSVRILRDEFPYQAFITGLMAVESGKYEIVADHEAGNGYYDVRMKRFSGSDPNICLEIKHSNTDVESQNDIAKSALAQIYDKDYTRGLSGPTLIYGISFRGKEPTIVMERL